MGIMKYTGRQGAREKRTNYFYIAVREMKRIGVK